MQKGSPRSEIKTSWRRINPSEKTLKHIPVRGHSGLIVCRDLCPCILICLFQFPICFHLVTERSNLGSQGDDWSPRSEKMLVSVSDFGRAQVFTPDGESECVCFGLFITEGMSWSRDGRGWNSDRLVSFSGAGWIWLCFSRSSIFLPLRLVCLLRSVLLVDCQLRDDCGQYLETVV